jgi:cell division protein FtsQ
MNKNTKVEFSMRKVKIFLFIVLLTFPISLSYKWASYRNFFDTKEIKIEGNLILEHQNYLEIIGNIKEKQIADIDIKKLSKELEAVAFVKAARVSKQYPNQVNINIVERKPIAIINNKKQFLIDQEAVIIANRNSYIESALIPMLSGLTQPMIFTLKVGKLSQLKLKRQLKYLYSFSLIMMNFLIKYRS